MFGQTGRRKGAEWLTVLDLVVEPLLGVLAARIGQDRPVAERSRAGLHSALEPADDLAGGDRGRGGVDDVGFPAELQPGLPQRGLDLLVGELRPEEDVVA